MEVQQFFLKIGDGDIASYHIIIPVLNMTEDCLFEVTTEEGELLKAEKTDSGDFVIERHDGPCRYRARIEIKNKDGTVVDEKTIEVAVSKGYNPELVKDVAKEVENAAKVFAKGQYPLDPMKDKLYQLIIAAKGEDIAIVCDLYFKSDATTEWRRSCLFYFQCAHWKSALPRKYHLEIVNIITHALHANESEIVVNEAVNIAVVLQVPSMVKYSLLLFALQSPSINNSSKHYFGSGLYCVLQTISNITPTIERKKVALIVAHLLVESSDPNFQNLCINIISAFGCRDVLPVIRDYVEICHANAPVLGKLVSILQSWTDTASAPNLLEKLDLTTDTTVAALIINTLKQFNYRQAIPQIQAMIPVSEANKVKVLENGLLGWQ